jgi:ribose transport system permease protein
VERRDIARPPVTPGGEHPVSRRPDRLFGGPAVRTGVALAAVWLALIAVTAARNSTFLSYQTLVAVAFSMSIVGVLSAGFAVVTISGGLADLSIPSSTGFAALSTTAVLANHGSALAVFVGIVAGSAFGLANALIIVGLKLNPIVTTLGTNFVGLGVLNIIFGREDLRLSSGLRHFALSRVLGLPSTWWVMVLVLLVTALLMANTRYGQRAIAAGGDSVVARRRGVHLPAVRIATYSFMGVCAGLAGVIYAGQAQNVTSGDTTGLLFQVVTAVILSGFSLRGGQGSLWILILGVGFLSTVPTSLVFLGFSTSWQQFWQGALLVIAVAVDGFHQKRRLK